MVMNKKDPLKKIIHPNFIVPRNMFDEVFRSSNLKRDEKIIESYKAHRRKVDGINFWDNPRQHPLFQHIPEKKKKVETVIPLVDTKYLKINKRTKDSSLVHYELLIKDKTNPDAGEYIYMESYDDLKKVCDAITKVKELESKHNKPKEPEKEFNRFADIDVTSE